MKTVATEVIPTGSQGGSPLTHALFRPARATDRVCALIVVIALAGGVGLRVARLGSVPAGFSQDEACDGYDAYSILKTGRDQHGNFLPLLIQAFNDYRMPLFPYSLVPLIGAFGLHPATVRLGAALWGSADLVAITILGGLTLGWPGAATVAVLGALSPWHLTVSRYGVEKITASGATSLAMVCFFSWLHRRNDRWLLLSGMFFGLSLYSYSITKVFTPLMMVLLTLLYRRELRQSAGKAFAALAIVTMLAAPQAVAVLRHLADTQANFKYQSLFEYMRTCPGCGPAEHARMASYSLLERAGCFAANWLSYFTPSFLFIRGDLGDHWQFLHPQGFGQLLPEQAVLIVLALIALLSERRRRLALLLIGWLILAALPGALTEPQGIWQLEPHEPPTAWVLLNHAITNVALTPRLLLSHPDSRRDVLAMAPWALLSALGLVMLLDLSERLPRTRVAALALLGAGVMFHGVRFVRSYFGDYPIVAAPYFQYGMQQVISDIHKLDDGHLPIFITDRVNQPYIYVLFFEQYPPALFQRQGAVYGPGALPRPSMLFAPVLGFDRYTFGDVADLYSKSANGIFVFAGVETLPARPALSVHYPDGSVAYNILVKRPPNDPPRPGS